MKAVCWQGANNVRVETVPDPKILNPRDAIIKITSTAICGSDLHLYNGYIPAMEKGDILGHEFMGEVVELGSRVKNVQIGDRVVVPFNIACGGCIFCQRQLWSLCDNSNPNSWMVEKLLTIRHIWLLPLIWRLRRRSSRIRTCAICRCRLIQNSR
jgi:threonine dehydrogenase-like Zn-dependent dehydrogenase